MNAELIAVLEHMEREKGVSRLVLISAIETALVSAAKKVLRDANAEVEAKVDPLTGEMTVTSEGEKIQSSKFGRIAAQTAKQVIIQKIRDAERDVVFEEFEPKINHIVSGTIYRYDKGTVIIDLGKTEAVLPKREQSPRDVYRQGERLRVQILEVNKEGRGPQIVVSRINPNLVKRLFEMEVPEVLDSIVEIKSVSREAGDRSKISVWSKDEKVDCVGACVGMRGSRVKNIVRELQGEKIDIVRWSDNIQDYVKGALSPAECKSIQVEEFEEKKIQVIVEDDQLSLAIGKNGQNVRLASKLTGWNIDIKSVSEAVGVAEGASLPENLSDVDGVTPKIQEKLVEAGIKTPKDLKEISEDELMKLEGVGAKTVERIKAFFKANEEEAAQKSEASAEEGKNENKRVSEEDLIESVKSKLLSKEPEEGSEKQEEASEELPELSNAETEENSAPITEENKETADAREEGQSDETQEKGQ